MVETWSREAYEALVFAVIERAVYDYENALKALKRDSDNLDAARTAAECETFFKKHIGRYSDMSGEYIMRVIRERLGGRR